MIEVTLTLQDRNERAWFGRMMDDLEDYRAKRALEGTTVAAGADIAPEEDYTFESEPQVIAKITPETVETKVPAEVAPAAPGTLPTEAQMFAALRKYIRTNNYAAAHELLAKHGVTKVTEPMADTVKLAIYADLSKVSGE